MVFCYQNCSDLLWEKNVLVIKKNFWNSRLKANNLQFFWDHLNNLFGQWIIRPIFSMGKVTHSAKMGTDILTENTSQFYGWSAQLVQKFGFIIKKKGFIRRLMLKFIQVFLEGHKILRNLHHRFFLCSANQIHGGDFSKICGRLRIYELYFKKWVWLSNWVYYSEQILS